MGVPLRTALRTATDIYTEVANILKLHHAVTALAAIPGTLPGAISQAVATADAVHIYRTRVIRAP